MKCLKGQNLETNLLCPPGDCCTEMKKDHGLLLEKAAHNTRGRTINGPYYTRTHRQSVTHSHTAANHGPTARTDTTAAALR